MKPSQPSQPTYFSRDIRCMECGALLARERDNLIEIRRHDLALKVEGTVRIRCYRCRTENSAQVTVG